MNPPKEATSALIDFMSALIDFMTATNDYGKLLDAMVLCDIHPPHPSFDQGEALIRDAEQALIKIFTAVLGDPDE